MDFSLKINLNLWKYFEYTNLLNFGEVWSFPYIFSGFLRHLFSLHRSRVGRDVPAGSESHNARRTEERVSSRWKFHRADVQLLHEIQRLKFDRNRDRMLLCIAPHYARFICLHHHFISMILRLHFHPFDHACEVKYTVFDTPQAVAYLGFHKRGLIFAGHCSTYTQGVNPFFSMAKFLLLRGVPLNTSLPPASSQ